MQEKLGHTFGVRVNNMNTINRKMAAFLHSRLSRLR